MNVNSACKIGIKILAAVIAGAAVIIGIDKAGKNDRQQNTGKPSGGVGTDAFSGFPGSGGTGEAGSGSREMTKTETLLTGIQAAGETCGRLFTFAQSLSQVIESAGRVFGGYRGPSMSGGPSFYTPGYNSNNAPAQGFRGGNIVWVPVNGSNCILQGFPAQ